MKALMKYGYKFKLLNGYEFCKINLFSDYVQHFYNIKKILVDLVNLLLKFKWIRGEISIIVYVYKR